MLKVLHSNMSFIGIITVLVCLPSCVYIGIQGQIKSETQHTSGCTSGSKKENKTCMEKLKILNESIERQKSN
jgi:hypothetical protein